MVARGSSLFHDILSSNLLVDAALRYYYSFKLIYHLLQFSSEKSVSELGYYFKKIKYGTFTQVRGYDQKSNWRNTEIYY